MSASDEATRLAALARDAVTAGSQPFDIQAQRWADNVSRMRRLLDQGNSKLLLEEAKLLAQRARREYCPNVPTPEMIVDLLRKPNGADGQAHASAAPITVAKDAPQPRPVEAERTFHEAPAAPIAEPAAPEQPAAVEPEPDPPQARCPSEPPHIDPAHPEPQAVTAETDNLTQLIPLSKSNPTPANCEANALRIVRAMPRFAQVYFDTFEQRIKLRNAVEDRPWLEEDDTVAVAYVQATIAPRITRDILRSALNVVARERSEDSLVKFLQALPPWDGIKRIGSFFVDVAGAENTPHVQAAGHNLFIGMIARAKQPGCELHYVTILEGPQGQGKNALFKAVGGPFYTEMRAPVDSTDFLRALRGAWLVHMGELGSIKRGELELVKDRVSASADEFTEKYERNPRRYPRRCVIVGSTNRWTYLTDESGNRRFIPVRCGSDPIRIELVQANRGQLFAEALARYSAGERWYEWPPETSDEQAQRIDLDPWHQRIAEYLSSRDEVTMQELLTAVDIPTDRQDRSHQTRIGFTLRVLGWRLRGRKRVGGTQTRVYTRAE